MSGAAFEQTAPAPLEHRRADVERQRDAQAQYFKVYGEIEVTGLGESFVEVQFPVYFVQKPALHFGGDIANGSIVAPTPGNGDFPTWSATVLTWDTNVKGDGSLTYSGAVIGIVTTGQDGQVANIHWSVEGIGLRNPTNTNDNNDP